MTNSVIPGCVTLLREKERLLRNARVGLLTHPAGVLPDLTYLYDRMIDDPDIDLTVLFGPEHGLAAVAQDQIAVGSSQYRGVPVYSLYGDKPADLRPTPEMLDRCDVLVVDLQDIGSRYYTYVYTMAYCLEACAEAGKRVIVCDRPNPLNGIDLEGPLLEPAFASFVGRFPLPVRHGMTIGELASMWNAQQGYNADLTVLACDGWRRDMWFDQCELPWVAPSPNMPTLSTATVYPGGCLIEGTNLSEGRGSTQPFEVLGAPFLDGREWAEKANALELPGVKLRPIAFQPTFHKHAKTNCGGLFVHVTDRSIYRPFRTYLELIAIARDMAPNGFAWREEPYEFENERLAIDLLCGSDVVRKRIEAGAGVGKLEEEWQNDLNDFAFEREVYLLSEYTIKKN